MYDFKIKSGAAYSVCVSISTEDVLILLIIPSIWEFCDCGVI